MKRRSVVFRKSHTLARKILSGILSVAIVAGPLPMMGTDGASALPRGGTVTRGGATLAYSTSRLLVNQSTSRASFSWASFNVKSGQSVVYRTPGSSAVSMNFIGGASPATIMGSVKSNGILEFMDAGGLIFGQGSVVSAAGVMAFGSSTPWGAPTGVVKNSGTITANSGQTVALVGTQVSNSGTITAPGGTIVLVAGATVTPIASTRTSSFSVVTTGGGTVMDSGVLSAETEGGQPGRIVLQSGMDSGTTTLASTAVLDASAPNGGNGGVVLVNGSGVVMNNAMPVNVSAPYGTAGTVKIDPNYTLSGTTLDICNSVGLEWLDANQTSYLGDTINLEGNMNLGGFGWTPLGNSSNPFNGTFNGNGYTVSGYTITASSDGTGFIGYLGGGGMVEKLGVSGTVNGGTQYNCVGGLVGINSGTISYSYATGSVTGAHFVGGLVGVNRSTISYSYATGNVSGQSSVGGLVGHNCFASATISYSYATGSATGSTYVGGLVGCNLSGTYSNSYWNKTATATGIGYGSSTGATGLSATAFGSSVNFSGWCFNIWSGGKFTYSSTSSPWFMGSVPTGGTTITAPILVGDLPSDTIAANNASKIYDGIESDPNGATQTVSLGVSPIPSSDITYSGDPNAGPQTVTPGVSSSYFPTTQSSLGSFTFIPGTLTIGKATLTLSGTEVYNGTKTLAGSHLTATGVDGQTFSVSGTGTGDLSTANVQTNQPLANVTNLTLGTSANGGLAANYNGLSTAGSSVSVTPATLTATANASMTYGSSVPTLSGTVTGFVNGQTLASDGGTASWTTSATSTSNAGSYAITGSVTLGSPYSGDYTINGFQLTGSNVTTIVGAVTIAPAILGLSTTATKIFDGKAGIVLTSDNSSLTGVVAGQTAGLNVDIPATLSSSSIGSDLGGTVSLDSGDLTGNSAFFSALSAGDYILPTTFTGGRVFSLSSGPVIPAYQASVSEASLAENSANAGTGREAASLPSFPLPPVANFVSPLGGGLNMGDLTDDSSTIFGLNTESSAVPSKSSDQTIYTIDSTYVFPAETQSLNDESAEKTAEPSGSNGEKSSSEGRSRMSDTLDSITLAGSRASSYSLQVPTFNDSVGGVFESQEAR